MTFSIKSKASSKAAKSSPRRLDAFALSLLAASVSFAVSSSEFILSPSISTFSHLVDVQSEQSELKRSDFVYGLDSILEATYKGPWIEAGTAVNYATYRYSTNQEENLSKTEYSANIKTGEVSERVQLHANWFKKRDFINSIRGGFEDDIFTKDLGVMLDNLYAGARYSFPEHWELDGAFAWDLSKNKTTKESDLSEHTYRIDTWTADFGQYSKDTPLRWKIDPEMQFTKRNKAQKYQSLTVDSDISIPLERKHQIRLVGTQHHSEYKNPGFETTNSISSNSRFDTVGLGVSWQSMSTRTFGQLTREYDTTNKIYHFGGKVRYIPNAESYIYGGFSRKFYGSSYYTKTAYQFKDTTVSLSYDEGVTLMYLLAPERFLTGVYQCPEGAQDDDISTCIKIEDLNTIIQPGNSIRPYYETLFPLVDRLSLNKKSMFTVEHNGLRWHSFFNLQVNKMQDLEYNLRQNSEEGTYQLTRGKGRTREYQFAWDFRKQTFSPSGEGTHQRRYRVSYQHNLNRNSYWKVSLQHINQDTFFNNYDYVDNRVSLSYTHHFGDKNIHIQELKDR